MSQGDSHGLATLEPLVQRVGLWRHRHRARASQVVAYQVVYDGAVVAEIEAGSKEALDDELAYAAWDLAQSVGRPVTADVIAMGAGGVELAKLPMRVLPAAPPTPAAGDAVLVKTLLDANRDLMRLVVDVLGAVTSQQKTIAEVTTELARSSGRRAVNAEAEAATATATALDALAAAREAAAPARTAGDRGLDLVEAFLRDRMSVGAGGATPDALNATTPTEGEA